MKQTSGWLVQLVLLVIATSSSAEVKVIVERNSDIPGPEYKFKNVPPPSRNDAGSNAVFSLVAGQRDRNGAELAVLHDGRVPADEDAPADNFFFRQATDGGRILVTLAKPIEIKQVNTYSWHASTRAPQVYKLYGSEGTASEFQREPARDTDPAKVGWKFLANVDTRPSTRESGGQYGVSISDPSGSLGKYQYLLFDISRTEDADPFGNTFYSEIDVIDRDGPTPQPIDTKPLLGSKQLISIDGGKYSVLIDTSDTPDLTNWVQEKVAPMIQAWYPKLVTMLPSDGFTAPEKFSIVFNKDMRGVADTSGTRIRCAATWMRSNIKGEALGAIFHEMVHVVQQYGRTRRAEGSTRPPGWLTEGLTDYIRWYYFEPQTRGAEISKRGLERARYDGSYRVTANFLKYVSDKQGENFVPKLNALIREGKYSPEQWKSLTGQTVEELGGSWKKELESKLSASNPPAPTVSPAKSDATPKP